MINIQISYKPYKHHTHIIHTSYKPYIDHAQSHTHHISNLYNHIYTYYKYKTHETMKLLYNHTKHIYIYTLLIIYNSFNKKHVLCVCWCIFVVF